MPQLTQQSSMAMDSMPQSGLKTSLILQSSILVLVVVSTRILIHIQEGFWLRRFQTPHTMLQPTLLSLMEMVNTLRFILKISLILKSSTLVLVVEWIKITIHILEAFLHKKFQTLHTMPQPIPLNLMETVNIAQFG